MSLVAFIQCKFGRVNKKGQKELVDFARICGAIALWATLYDLFIQKAPNKATIYQRSASEKMNQICVDIENL
jgi:hypothetical protein